MATSVEVIVPAGKVASTLTGFVMRIDLADMTTAWWNDTTSDLGNVRVTSGGVNVPFDITRYNRTAKTGELFTKVTLTTANNAIQVTTVNGATALPATDPNGRNATWSSEDFVFIGTSLINRVNGNALSSVGQRWDYTYKYQGNLPDEHLQGMTRDTAGKWYVISTDRLRRYSSDWTLEKTKTGTIAATGIRRINHIGDPYYYNGEIYAPAEVYPADDYNNQRVTVWDPTTLEFKRQYNISDGGHEVSSMCRNSINGEWYISDYTRDNRIWRYDANFAFLGHITTTVPTLATQGIEFYNGYIWIVAGKGEDSTTLYRVDPANGNTTEMYTHLVAAGGEGLHVDQADGSFYWISQKNKRVFSMIPSTTEIGFGGSGYVTATVPKRTAWTMSAAGFFSVQGDGNRNAGLVSYGSNIATNTDRASIVVQAAPTPSLGIWDADNSWLNSAVNPSLTRVRATQTFNGTTSRKLYINGSLAVTDNTVVQKPAGTGTTLFIGAEDTSLAEGWRGTVNYVRLRNGELSAAWLAAENESWTSSSTFYWLNLIKEDTAYFGGTGTTLISARLEGVATFTSTGSTTVNELPLIDREHSPNPRYRYYIADTLSGRLIMEASFTGVTYNRKIRRAGEFSGTVALPEDKQLAEAYWALMPGKSSVFITRNGVPVWGGIINNRSYSAENRSLSVGATTYESVFYRRYIWHSLSYPNNQDQYSVVRSLLAMMQTDFDTENTSSDHNDPHPDNADLDITVDGRISGHTQDTQTWLGYELRPFGEVLETFSNNLNGFEYNIEIGIDAVNNQFTKRLVFRQAPPSQMPEGVEYTGPKPGLNENYFEYPGNIIDISYEDTLENAATRYYVAGKQPDPIGEIEQPKPYGVWHNEGYLSTQWPLYEVIESSDHADVSNVNTLDDYAETYGIRAKPPGSEWSVVVNGGMRPFVGSYVPGDWCQLVVSDPFLVQGIESTGTVTKKLTKRIAEFSVAVPDVQQVPETVTLTLIDEWEAGGT